MVYLATYLKKSNKLAFDININGMESSHDDQQFIAVDIFYNSLGLEEDGTYKTSFHTTPNDYHFTNIKFFKSLVA